MTAELAIWTLEPEQVYRALASSPDGLTDREAALRLARYGPNELPELPRRLLPLRFFDQLTHVMAILLWVAGFLAFVSGTPELGWAIWAVILINAGFSFWQEYRAERALAALTRILPAQARVYRDGRLRVAPARELVPGDVVQLDEGDRVSADARVVDAETLFLELSVLTGESHPHPRHPEPAAMDGLPTTESSNLVYAGTTVAAGRGTAVVYATGARTVFGKIAHLTATVKREPSTLEVQVARITRVITILSLTIGAAVFLLAYLLVGVELREAFIFAIGIVVANVPEGLLPTVTLSLAVSVQRMARHNALVRRLSAVETLSATTVICTDKTGTLTKNEMTVREIWLPGGTTVEVTGAGYSPVGEVGLPAVGGVADAARLLLAGSALCSNARVGPAAPGERWQVVGDPTEGALLVAAHKAGLAPDRLRHAAPRLHEVLFDAHRKMMSVVVQPAEPGPWPADVRYLAFTKGAPLEVLERCRAVLRDGHRSELGASDRAEIAAANDVLAARGLRVLGVAYRDGDADLAEASASELERDLTCIGLVAMEDPPRPEVRASLAICRRAGIRVTMVTGDDPHTAEAIARHIGLVEDVATLVTGRELDGLSDDAVRHLLQSAPGLVFARTAPEQKLRLVQAYKGLGHIVAVTGDGVNDAPALRAAHIGIAMGISGTDVAREAADVVLVDDNFATIVSAVEQGRAIYANIRKFLTYVLASNVPELVPFVAMVTVKIPAALTIMQILSIDLGTDMVPALALGSEPPEPAVMEQAPRPKEQRLLDLSLLVRAYGFLGLLEAVVSMLGFLLVWWAHGIGLADLQRITPAIVSHTADPATLAIYREATTVTLVAIVASQIGNVFACRSERLSITASGLFGNPLVWLGVGVELAVILAVVTLPPLEAVFATVALSPLQWLVMLVLIPPTLLGAEELRKRLRGQTGA